jgi:aryl-alcohol dehydrogenase-like predicted oxidoreductase
VKLNPLGQTGLMVSELGFGAQAIGGNEHGNSYGSTSDGESIKAVHIALDRGCNFFDTADVYGFGHSETILGKALKLAGKLHDVVIATKGGCNFHRQPVAHDFSPEYLVQAVEASLQRLDREYIDLYQLHNPPMSVLRSEDLFLALDRLQAQGKIRHLGISIHSVDEGLACIKSGKVETLQVVYNLLSQADPDISAEALLPHVRASGIGLIAREPLANSFLAGTQRVDTIYEPGDMRGEWSLEGRRARIALCEIFRPLERTGFSLAQIALRFVLDEPAVSTTIVGVKTPAQAEENFGAPELPSFADLFDPRAARVVEQAQAAG